GGGALAAAIFSQPWLAAASLAITIGILGSVVRSATRSRDAAVAELDDVHADLDRQRERVSYEDPESGLGTAKQLEVSFVKQAARFERWEEAFSLAILEMKDAYRPERTFSPITAASIGRALLNVARSEDTVCRIDNGTFAVLLAATGADGADAFVARARTRVGGVGHPGDAGEVFVTIEAGVTMWRTELETIEAMVLDAGRDMERFIIQHDRQKRMFEADEDPLQHAG
ncbi:MAG TPA: diguanylate cyclase, partial [Tepidiformaceae bacterium]|nr:diguanylate cyclase [Tepidiformaceae bacterium]